MKVNIYLETDKQTQEYTWRKYGYVLEAMCGRRPPVTRVGFGSVEGTYHKCNLQALAEALAQFRKECEVCIHTKDAFVAARILKIDEMAAADFKDTKGKPIKNAQEWESICRKVSECTYARIPIPKYSPRSLAAKDYEDLVTEYIAELNISGGEK